MRGNSLGSGALVLIVGVALLWLAVTGKIGRLSDAWGVLTGKVPVQRDTSGKATSAFTLPTLPSLGSLKT